MWLYEQPKTVAKVIMTSLEDGENKAEKASYSFMKNNTVSIMVKRYTSAYKKIM